LTKAVAAGIPVICVDADVPESRRVMYIGTDNGRPEREREANGGAGLKGNIIVITIPGQRNLDDSVAGVADALKNYPSLKLMPLVDDKGDWRSAFDQISEMILKKEKIDGIICLEATGGPARRTPEPVRYGRQDSDRGVRQRSEDIGLDRKRGQSRRRLLRTLCDELLRAEIPGRLAPQRSERVQGLAHGAGTSSRGWWIPEQPWWIEQSGRVSRGHGGDCQNHSNPALMQFAVA